MITDWNATKAEVEIINKIAKRAAALKMRCAKDYQGLQMDLMACHLYGNPMDFEKLLAADDFNFAHDVAGINGHIDRQTGKLTRCFLPRCTKRTGYWIEEGRTGGFRVMTRTKNDTPKTVRNFDDFEGARKYFNKKAGVGEVAA